MSDGSLRQIFSKHIRRAMWIPVETGSTMMGVPDSHYCFPDGISGWVENKFVSSGNKVKIWPTQVAWLERYSRNNGRCFIAVRKGTKDLYLFKGSDARKVYEKGLLQKAAIHTTGGPAKWDWDRITEALVAAPDRSPGEDEG
jgi:hypothetical protein